METKRNNKTNIRSPMKELCVKNHKPAEMNDKPDKQINIDTESSKNLETMSTIFDVEGNGNIEENRENQNPIKPSTNFNSQQKTETDELLLDSHCDPLNVTPTLNDIPGSYTSDNFNEDLIILDTPRNEYSTIPVDDSFINAFAEKININRDINVDSENCSINEQNTSVINSSGIETIVDEKDNQFNIKFYKEKSETPIVKNLIENQEKSNEYSLTKSDLTTVSFGDKSVDNQSNSYSGYCNNSDQITILSDRNLIDAENENISNLNNTNTTAVSPNVTSDVILSSENLTETENNNVSDLNKSIETIISSDGKRNIDDEIRNKSNSDVSTSNTSINFSTEEQITDKSITAVSNENEYIDTKSDLVTNEDCIDSKNEYTVINQDLDKSTEEQKLGSHDFTNTLVAEEIQMSSSEPNSEVKEQLTNSAACTNQMGDIINQDECFEKQLDISNGAIHNKESLEEKARLYKEMTEKYTALEAETEKYKIQVNDLKKELKKNELNLKDLQRKEVKLADDLTCKTASEVQISRVMEEYEKSISTLVSENEKMKKERDTAQMHLANIEMAFSDVHQKYERCKAIVQGYKDNEESFKQDIAMNRETIVIQEQKYETLKAHAMAQLEKSNQELAAMKKQHEAEVARLTAQLKRYEIKNMSLMESLQQKAKECEQLSAVCDEFIGNV